MSTQQDSAAIKEKAISSVKWAGLSVILPRFISPLVTIIVGQRLAPEDFGIVGIAIALNTFADIIVGYNWGQAIIRSEENVNDVANISFWMMGILSIILYGIFWFLAPAVAAGYKNPFLVTVIRLISLTIIISATSLVPKALMEREFRYQHLFVVRTVSTTLTNIVILIWVFIAPSIWVIVAQPILIAVTQSFTSYYLTKWRPQIYWNWKQAKQIISFNSVIIFATFITWVLIYGDNLFAGALLGATQLGIYVLGWNLALIIPNIVSGSVGQVAYTTFSRFKDEQERVGLQFIHLQRLFSIILFPISAGIAIIAQPLAQIIYGENWGALPTVMMLLSLMTIFTFLWNLNELAFRAIGRPVLGVIAPILLIAYGAPALFMFGRDDVIAYSLTRTLIMVPFPFMVMVVTQYAFGISVLKQMQAIAWPFIITAMMFGLGYFCLQAFGPLTNVRHLPQVGLIIIICAAFYGLMMFIFQRPLMLQIRDMFMSNLKRRNAT